MNYATKLEGRRTPALKVNCRCFEFPYEVETLSVTLFVNSKSPDVRCNAHHNKTALRRAGKWLSSSINFDPMR